MKNMIWISAIISLLPIFGAHARDYKEMTIADMERVLFDQCDTTLSIPASAAIDSVLQQYGVNNIRIEYLNESHFIRVDIGLSECLISIDPQYKKIDLTGQDRIVAKCMGWLEDMASNVCGITFGYVAKTP